MGEVITNTGTSISIPEIDGRVTMQELYQDMSCGDYGETYRVTCITACGKLGRAGWGALHTLHELAKGTNARIAEAATAAIHKIDPGMPDLTRTASRETTRAGGRPEGTFRHETGNGTVVYRKPEIKQVTFTEVNGGLADGARVYGTCSFCDKTVIFGKDLRRYNDVLSGTDAKGNKRNHCAFCLRNEFYKRKYSKNVLLMSLRGIIGYYYYCFHYVPRTNSMWVPDIQAYVELHVKMGVQNPLFRYDPETFTWFVDFAKVGTRARQMPLSYVLETVVQMIASFNIYEHVKDVSAAAFYQKFRGAIVDFHNHRRRPSGQRLLVPTLFGCGIPMENSLNRAIPISLLKNFLPTHLQENYKRGRM